MKNIILGIIGVIVIGLAGHAIWAWQQTKVVEQLNTVPVVVQNNSTSTQSTNEVIVTDEYINGTTYIDKKGGWEMKIPNTVPVVVQNNSTSTQSTNEVIVTDEYINGTTYIDKKGGWEMKIPNDLYHKPPEVPNVMASLPGAWFCHGGTDQGPNCAIDSIKVNPYTSVAEKYHSASDKISYDEMLKLLQKLVSQYSSEMTLEKRDTLTPKARVIKITNPSAPYASRGNKINLNPKAVSYYIFYSDGYIIVEMSSDKFESVLLSMRLI